MEFSANEELESSAFSILDNNPSNSDGKKWLSYLYFGMFFSSFFLISAVM